MGPAPLALETSRVAAIREPGAGSLSAPEGLPLTVLDAPIGAESVARALRAGAEWVWLVDRAVSPRPHALERLLAEAPSGTAAGRPVLLASIVVTPEGGLDANTVPWPRFTDKEVAIAACERRLVALRAVRSGSLLVHRDALDRVPLPPAGRWRAGGDLAWSARVLRRQVGILVPQSVGVRDRPGTAGGAARELAARARALSTGAWDLEERLWYLAGLLRDAARLAGGRG